MILFRAQRSIRTFYLAPLLAYLPLPSNAFPTLLIGIDVGNRPLAFMARTFSGGCYSSQEMCKEGVGGIRVRKTYSLGHQPRMKSFSRTITSLPGIRERRYSSSSRDEMNLNGANEGRENKSATVKSAEEELLAKEEFSRNKRIGQAKQRLQKAVSREDRISVLELKMKRTLASVGRGEDPLTAAEKAELDGLLKVRSNFEEQYDPLTFTAEHLEFKAMHNDAFIALSRYCERDRHRMVPENRGSEKYEQKPINLFFLDGPDGGTTSAMIDRGNFEPEQCFVANRHASSCESLRISGGGRLPDQNVIHATAAEALTVATQLSPNSNGVEVESAEKDGMEIGVSYLKDESGALSGIDFSAYYFDGCGGFVPHIVGMMTAALLREHSHTKTPQDPSGNMKKTIAVGYSLLGGNKNVVQKELEVSQALAIIARRRGLRMVHALDDPMRYGISADLKKIGGSGGSGTFTTWLVLEPLEPT